MNDKMTDLIAQLAAKLGTTADNVWAILIQSQQVLGLLDLAVCLVCLVIAAAAVRMTWWACHHDDWESDMLIWPVVVVITSVMIGFIALISAVVNGYDGILELVAPQYTALQEVLHLLGK